MTRTWLLAILLLLVLVSMSCRSTLFGGAKRGVLADRVEDARDGEEEARGAFTGALDRFFELAGDKGGDIEGHYDDLTGEVEDCEDVAKDVRGRIDDVSRTAAVVFEEWERELGLYTDPGLRKRSELSLTETRRQYQRTLLALRMTEKKMERVLRIFRDQVLFLKRNLNVRTVADLGSVASQLDAEVADLVLDIQKAIDESNVLLARMRK